MSNNSNNTDVQANSDVKDNTDTTDNSVIVAEIVANALNGDFSGYTGADVTIKANVRKVLNQHMMDAVDKLDMSAATAAKAAIEGCKGTKAAKVATPVNHTEIVANRAFTLISAGIALLRGEVVPTGINPEDVDFADNTDVQDFLDMIGDSDYLDNQAVRDIAGQKVTKSAERVDIGAHIAKVIEGAETGTFFSVRRIASTSTEFAPNGCPSDGAVAMRLFPQKGESTLIGTLPIKPVTVPVKGLIVL